MEGQIHNVIQRKTRNELSSRWMWRETIEISLHKQKPVPGIYQNLQKVLSSLKAKIFLKRLNTVVIDH